MYQIALPKESMKPREKLMQVGARKLSNQELLAIFLRTGTKSHSVNQVSQTILDNLTSLADFKHLSLQELQKIKGIGKVKSIEIKAMLELAHRIKEAELVKGEQIIGSKMLAEKMMAELTDKKQEHVVVLYLDTKNRIIEQRTIFIGSVRSSIVEAREILHYACKNMATALILVHNHPSGQATPSENDEYFTKKLKRACDDMGIVFLDHLVIGNKNYYSFRAETEILG